MFGAQDEASWDSKQHTHCQLSPSTHTNVSNWGVASSWKARRPPCWRAPWCSCYCLEFLSKCSCQCGPFPVGHARLSCTCTLDRWHSFIQHLSASSLLGTRTHKKKGPHKVGLAISESGHDAMKSQTGWPQSSRCYEQPNIDADPHPLRCYSVINKIKIDKYWCGYRETGILLCCWWEVNGVAAVESSLVGPQKDKHRMSM